MKDFIAHIQEIRKGGANETQGSLEKKQINPNRRISIK